MKLLWGNLRRMIELQFIIGFILLYWSVFGTFWVFEITFFLLFIHKDISTEFETDKDLHYKMPKKSLV